MQLASPVVLCFVLGKCIMRNNVVVVFAYLCAFDVVVMNGGGFRMLFVCWVLDFPHSIYNQ